MPSKTIIFHDKKVVCLRRLRPSEAANLAYLGLYALQHRAGTAAWSPRRTELHLHGDGKVEEIFQPGVLAQLPGSLPRPHALLHRGRQGPAQCPAIMIDCNKASRLPQRHLQRPECAEARTSRLDFQPTATPKSSAPDRASQARNLPARWATASDQVEGAYSLVMLTQDEFTPCAIHAAFPSVC